MKKLFAFCLLASALPFITSCKKEPLIGPAGEKGESAVQEQYTFTNVSITASDAKGFYYLDLPAPAIKLNSTVVVLAQQSVSNYTPNPGVANTTAWSAMPFYINGSDNTFLRYEVRDGSVRIKLLGPIFYQADVFNFKVTILK